MAEDLLALGILGFRVEQDIYMSLVEGYNGRGVPGELLTKPGLEPRSDESCSDPPHPAIFLTYMDNLPSKQLTYLLFPVILGDR